MKPIALIKIAAKERKVHEYRGRNSNGSRTIRGSNNSSGSRNRSRS